MAKSKELSVETSGQAELDQIAMQLREEIVEAERHYRNALQHAIRAGELLIRARELVPSGSWATWLAINFDGGATTAATYMRLARHATQVQHAQTITAAVALLAPTEPRALPATTDLADPDPMGNYRRASSALARALAYAADWKPADIPPGYLPLDEFRIRVQQLLDTVEEWNAPADVEKKAPRRKAKSG